MKYYPSINIQATGRRIRELRKQNNLRVEDVIEYLGLVSEQAVYKWQRGECMPTLDNMYALSILFNTTIEDIIIPMETQSMEEGESLPLDVFGNIFCHAHSGKINHRFIHGDLL